jgi:two-component system response regulator
MSERIILLVDDDPNDVELARYALRTNKITNQLVVANDGAEAWAFLQERPVLPATGMPALPALILLDMKMPKVGGLEVLQRIRADERLRLVPVVMLTSSAEQEDVIRSYRLGANSYVRKPIDFEQFTEAVRHLSQYWLGLNVPPPGRRHQ